MNKIFKLLLLLPLVAFASDRTLETDGFIILIESFCEEGEVSCNNYRYTGASKKSNNTIILNGSSWHSLCADGISPCRFLGYKFENTDVTYFVHESGLLEVIQGNDNVLLSQQGSWL